MSPQTDVDDLTEGRGQDVLAETQRGIVERLADPYLTDHDRWVLRQFALFLSGITPGPDPRVGPSTPASPCSARPDGRECQRPLERRPCHDGRH